VALWLFGAVVVSAGAAALAAVSLTTAVALSDSAAPVVIAAVESRVLARSAPPEQPVASKMSITRSYLNMWLSLLWMYNACGR
jgi:hypothetical protein